MAYALLSHRLQTWRQTPGHMTGLRLFLLAACASVFASHLAAQTTTIDNVTIVDVTNGKLQQRKTIVIEGGRIARIVKSTA